MESILKWSGLVALVIALVLLFSPGGVNKAVFGSTSCANITCLSGGLRLVTGAGGDFESDVAAVFTSTMNIGTSGTTLNRMNTGFCFLAPSATTIAATTTVSVDCQATAGWSAAGTSALAGVTSGDFVQFTLSTTTAGATGPGGIVATGASASTTAGYITVRLLNLTGTTFTWPTTGVASGTASYTITR